MRRPGVRARRPETGPRTEGRLSGQDSYPGDAAPSGDGQVHRGARTDRELQSTAERHRPRVPAGVTVPGRLHPDRKADRDRSARMVSARARETRENEPNGRAPEGPREPLGEGREAAYRGDRLRPRRPDQRLSSGGGGLSG